MTSFDRRSLGLLLTRLRTVRATYRCRKSPIKGATTSKTITSARCQGVLPELKWLVDAKRASTPTLHNQVGSLQPLGGSLMSSLVDSWGVDLGRRPAFFGSVRCRAWSGMWGCHLRDTARTGHQLESTALLNAHTSWLPIQDVFAVCRSRPSNSSHIASTRINAGSRPARRRTRPSQWRANAPSS